MFSAKEVIIYGSYSVCRIAEITQKEFDGKMVDYYVLKPVFNPDSTIFVPVNNETLQKRMHAVIRKEEALNLIKSMSRIETIWLDSESARKEKYKSILAERNRDNLVGLIKALHIHQQQQAEKKRRLHISDERFLKEAEKTLCEELAFVLEISPEDVTNLIRAQVQSN